MLRLCGADLREVPAVPYRDPNNYVKYSGWLAEELAKTEPNGAIWANQFDNVANRQGHYETTGPEIWEQTDGQVDAFICSVGTGGTLAGVGMFLKERGWKTAIGPGRHKVSSAYFWYFDNPCGGEAEYFSDMDYVTAAWKPSKILAGPSNLAEWTMLDGISRFEGFGASK